MQKHRRSTASMEPCSTLQLAADRYAAWGEETERTGGTDVDGEDGDDVIRSIMPRGTYY